MFIFKFLKSKLYIALIFITKRAYIPLFVLQSAYKCVFHLTVSFNSAYLSRHTNTQIYTVLHV